MKTSFYLDDYNLIRTYISESLLSGNIKLYKNDKEISYSISNDGCYISLSFFDEYKDLDKYFVKHDDDINEVIPRFITHTKRFDEEYKVDLSTLGSFYSKRKTLFRLWAPLNDEINLLIDNNKYHMEYKQNGLYEVEVKGNLEKKKYHYELMRQNKTIITHDPFAYSNSIDSDDSYVVDIDSFKFKNVIVKSTHTPIIYETSVRDFSSDINAPFKNKGKFISFLEEGLTLNNTKIGVDYLADLGITHLQLMPIYNFDLDNGEYNWGYNPLDYNSLYWGYVVDKDPYSPIIEFRSLVDELHIKGIKVNLDVVYNHVYHANDFSLDKILPFYFFRYNTDGTMGNATYCGNELRSESYFFREYINLINIRMIKLFDVDGFRYDLMGVLDVDTANYLLESARLIKEDTLMYSEGWNMGEILPEYKRAAINNAYKMPDYFFFNCYYRDALRGPNEEKYTKGFICGNREYDDELIDGLFGSYFNGLNEKQSLNYAECHDNMTVYDRISYFGYDEYTKSKICSFAIALLLISKGIPFIHAGEEFLRTKKGIDNSYNSSDEINKIDWSLRVNNKETVKYIKNIIKFRKEYDLNSKDATIDYFYGLIVLKYSDFDIVINPTEHDYHYHSWITYTKKIGFGYTDTSEANYFDVKGYSLVIAKKK